MSNNGLSNGRDQVIDIVSPSGVLRVTGLTSFQAHQDTTEQRVKLKNGRNPTAQFFDGWSGSFDLERQDSTLDDYFVQKEADYYAGIDGGTITITETISEPDGSVNQYRYVGVVLKFAAAGTWSTDNTVKQSVSFMAERKLKVA